MAVISALCFLCFLRFLQWTQISFITRKRETIMKTLTYHTACGVISDPFDCLRKNGHFRKPPLLRANWRHIPKIFWQLVFNYKPIWLHGWPHRLFSGGGKRTLYFQTWKASSDPPEGILRGPQAKHQFSHVWAVCAHYLSMGADVVWDAGPEHGVGCLLLLPRGLLPRPLDSWPLALLIALPGLKGGGVFHSLTHDLPTPSFTHSLIHLFTRSLIHHSRTHSFRSLTHSLTCSFTDALIHSFIRPLTHLPIPALILWLPTPSIHFCFSLQISPHPPPTA